MSKTHIFSGHINLTEEGKAWFYQSMNYYNSMREKIIRFFFLIKFKSALGCTYGINQIIHAPDGIYYTHEGEPFALEKDGAFHGIITDKELNNWIDRLPMKEFKMCGKIYKKNNNE